MYFRIIVIFLFVFSYAYTQDTDKLVGKIDTSESKMMALDQLNLLGNKPHMLVLDEVGAQLQKVSQEFKKAFPNVPFVIVSAFRSFDRQKVIWENKWKKLEQKYTDIELRRNAILEFSSFPGISRHHWGTDIDFLSVEPKYFETSEGQKIYQWFVKNLPVYGFFQPYQGLLPKGYKEEKWHWSYKPISSKFLKEYVDVLSNKPQEILKKIRLVKGFSKKEISDKDLIDLVLVYITNISH